VTGVKDISEEEWRETIKESRYQVVKLVNKYFYSRLEILPEVIEYIQKIKKK
jgi:hypothetical protein